uniref:Seipin n=2 Tax=Oryza TaxID=4527 RepID=A0A0D3H9C9_9ORYZ
MEADEPAAAAASTSLDSDDSFFDALDSLPSPPSPPHTPSSSTLRRRRPRRGWSLKQHEDDTAASPTFSDSSTITVVDEAVKPDSEETSSHRPPPPPEEEDEEDAAEAAVEGEVEARDAKLNPAPAPAPTPTPPPPGILESLAMLVIKAVVFQVSALISCLTFPIRLLQWWFLLVTDPLGLVRRARGWALEVAGHATGAAAARLGGGEGVGRMVARLAWGSLWAVYVCVVLCSILVMAFLGGGLLVGKVVEEPIQVSETLNFDYTKPSPVAFVPVQRLVPPNQRMQLEVFLTLPESDYNRRLGVFQVRAEFLSADGKVISTSSQPCMLKFKSAHMHFIETFLRSVSLLSGYSSESQVIRLKMRGITEASEPVMGIRIILEQRAEFSPGAGIPEIYAASLKLEAELPLLKRILWNWRWTLFVWSSMGFFVFELLLALICYPVYFPGVDITLQLLRLAHDFGDQTTVDIITLRATARKQPNHGPRLGDAKVAFRVRTNYHKGKWARQYCIIRRCSWSCRQRQCQQEADTNRAKIMSKVPRFVTKANGPWTNHGLQSSCMNAKW